MKDLIDWEKLVHENKPADDEEVTEGDESSDLDDSSESSESDN